MCRLSWSITFFPDNFSPNSLSPCQFLPLEVLSLGCCSNYCEVGLPAAPGIIPPLGFWHQGSSFLSLPFCPDSVSLGVRMDLGKHVVYLIQLREKSKSWISFMIERKLSHTHWKSLKLGLGRWLNRALPPPPFKWWGTKYDPQNQSFKKIQIGRGDGCLQSQPLGGGDRGILGLTG